MNASEESTSCVQMGISDFQHYQEYIEDFFKKNMFIYFKKSISRKRIKHELLENIEDIFYLFIIIHIFKYVSSVPHE